MWNGMYSKMPTPMGANMFKTNVLTNYDNFEQELKNLIVEEVNKKGLKIPGINK
jgi:hypothetical protein